MEKITLLPKWDIPSSIPSVYDRESGTCIEMTAKVYGAMRKLQEEYNGIVDEINKTITEFINGTNTDQEKFKEDITEIIHNYIIALDAKVNHQDRVIEENITYIKNNIGTEVSRIINEMKESGEIEEIIADALDGINTKLTAIETDVNTLKENVSTLQTKVSANETNIKSLQTNTTNLDDRLDELEKMNVINEYNANSETLTISFKEVTE